MSDCWAEIHVLSSHFSVMNIANLKKEKDFTKTPTLGTMAASNLTIYNPKTGFHAWLVH